MTRVLIVDDEPQILRALRINLTARQYEVVTATDGSQALHAAARDRPDLVVLDLGLPDIDGAEVIRSLRTWTPVPIIVLSGRSDSRDKVDALDAGADDYVTKPFSVDELLARIRAVTRRRTAADVPATVHIGRYEIDLSGRTATDGDGGTAHLTRTEWQLLEVLARNPASSSVNANCSRRSGAPRTSTKRRTSGSTWRTCAASSRRTRPGRSISSPSPAWATGSAPDPDARRPVNPTARSTGRTNDATTGSRRTRSSRRPAAPA
jgi:two-component system KDP operon response regulator KdpE